jgi:hypothetical protein
MTNYSATSNDIPPEGLAFIILLVGLMMVAGYILRDRKL